MDNIDDAQERAAQILERQLAAATGKFKGVSATFCEECGDPIPEKRRGLLPGVQHCVDCQSMLEKIQRNYR